MSERSTEAASSLQARLAGLDGLKDRNDDSESAFFVGHPVHGFYKLITEKSQAFSMRSFA